MIFSVKTNGSSAINKNGFVSSFSENCTDHRERLTEEDELWSVLCFICPNVIFSVI